MQINFIAMLQRIPGKIRPVIVAFSIWILTILAGAFIFITIVAVDRGVLLINNIGANNEDYSEIFSFFCLFAGLFSTPAAVVYIILFALLARADLPRYVAGTILSFLSAVAVFITIRYLSDSKDVIFLIVKVYLSPLIVLSWAGVYISYPRHITVAEVQK